MLNEKQKDVVEKIFELLSTMDEALKHIINKQLVEIRYEDSLHLLNDFVEAFTSINNAAEGLVNNYDNILEKALILKNNLSDVIAAYNQNNYEKIVEIYKYQIIPAFNTWRNEIESNLSEMN
ncbi:hypothetical protein ACAG39_08105 [Caldicellulosiruptoraceae bacterium PP1]